MAAGIGAIARAAEHTHVKVPTVHTSGGHATGAATRDIPPDSIHIGNHYGPKSPEGKAAVKAKSEEAEAKAQEFHAARLEQKKVNAEATEREAVASKKAAEDARQEANDAKAAETAERNRQLQLSERTDADKEALAQAEAKAKEKEEAAAKAEATAKTDAHTATGAKLEHEEAQHSSLVQDANKRVNDVQTELHGLGTQKSELTTKLNAQKTLAETGTDAEKLAAKAAVTDLEKDIKGIEQKEALLHANLATEKQSAAEATGKLNETRSALNTHTGQTVRSSAPAASGPAVSHTEGATAAQPGDHVSAKTWKKDEKLKDTISEKMDDDKHYVDHEGKRYYAQGWEKGSDGNASKIDGFADGKFQRHKTPIIVAGVVSGAILGYAAYNYNKKKQEQQAAN